MFRFKLEPDKSLLTVVRTGSWSLDTVASYEVVLRRELKKLHQSGGSTSFIIDVRSTGAQAQDVTDALLAMVRRLRPLHAKRTAVIASPGIAKLQAIRVADVNSRVFSSMALARDWVLDVGSDRVTGAVHDEPSDAYGENVSVHVLGPSDVEVSFTPIAALETARRIEHAAIEVLLDTAASSLTLEEKRVKAELG